MPLFLNTKAPSTFPGTLETFPPNQKLPIKPNHSNHIFLKYFSKRFQKDCKRLKKTVSQVKLGALQKKQEHQTNMAADLAVTTTKSK
jgi:hypothetical protein